MSLKLITNFSCFWIGEPMCWQERIWSMWLQTQANPECQSKKNHTSVTNANCPGWHADNHFNVHAWLPDFRESPPLRENNYLTSIQ